MKRPIAYVALYRPSLSIPIATSSQKLSDIVASTHQPATYGLGLRVEVIRDGERGTPSSAVAREARVDIATAVAERYGFEVFYNSRIGPSGKGARLRICKGPPTSHDLRRARQARAYAVRLWRERGYRVQYVDDRGRDWILRPYKRTTA